MAAPRQDEPLAGEYWSWVAVSLYLLLTVDLLTSIYATAAIGIEAEANPLMAWLLLQPLGVIVSVHLVAIVLAGLGFYWLQGVLQRASTQRTQYFAIVVQIWLGGLISIGLLVFANNLALIVHGRGLLG